MNPESQEIDGLPFIDALRKSAEKAWSGILRVTKDSEQVGSVFMREGSIAWAVSKTQKENFSSFLERIGLVPREKLNEAVRKYKALGKAKKLGEVLEEEGLISHEKLRECLGEHIRAAIRSLMEDPQLVIEASHGEMTVDTNLMFNIGELLNGESTEHEAGTGEASPGEDSSTAADSEGFSKILDTLATLHGYLFSFVSEKDGKLLYLHRTEADAADPTDVVNSATEWINSSAKHWSGEQLGKLECIILEHENGLLVAKSTDEKRECFVTAAFGKEGKLGVIKHKLAEMAPSIQLLANCT